jgi:hypothetical protein
MADSCREKSRINFFACATYALMNMKETSKNVNENRFLTAKDIATAVMRQEEVAEKKKQEVIASRNKMIVEEEPGHEKNARVHDADRMLQAIKDRRGREIARLEKDLADKIDKNRIESASELERIHKNTKGTQTITIQTRETMTELTSSLQPSLMWIYIAGFILLEIQILYLFYLKFFF